MAIKHVEEYYSKVKNDYEQMNNQLELFAQQAQDNLVSPDQLKLLQDTIKPVLENYHSISYFMYLLHKPNRDSKSKRYASMNKKFIGNLKQERSPDNILKQNSDIICKLKGMVQ